MVIIKKKSKLSLLFILVTVSTVLIDQIFKYFIVAINQGFNLGIFSLDVVRNSGAGFGILQGKTLLLSIISLIVASGIILSYKKIPLERNIQILFALFLGGVLGNLIDRLVRRHVIDFINFSFWPSFNIADIAISIAAIGLVIQACKK